MINKNISLSSTLAAFSAILIVAKLWYNKRVRKTSKRKITKIPKEFQGILWSVDVGNLDLEKDKAYIIHQILEYGNFKEISWLFKIYSKIEIKEVFEKTPMKIYSPQGFNFVKSIILGFKKIISPEKYVSTIY